MEISVRQAEPDDAENVHQIYSGIHAIRMARKTLTARVRPIPNP
jgi:hypothetical protein